MSIYLSIVEILKFIGLLITTFLAVMAFSKKVRDYVIKIYNERQKFQKERKEMPNLIKKIAERMEVVEHELKPNGGGSIKDAINIMKAEMDANNWLSPRPTFRCTSSGSNIFVNEAYCHLCGVTPEELMKLGWRSFAADEDQADDYYDRFMLSTKEQSQFSGRLKIKTKQDEYRGEWTIRIRPLGAITKDGEEDFLWHGALWPYDQKAKEYAKAYNIPLI